MLLLILLYSSRNGDRKHIKHGRRHPQPYLTGLSTSPSKSFGTLPPFQPTESNWAWEHESNMDQAARMTANPSSELCYQASIFSNTCICLVVCIKHSNVESLLDETTKYFWSAQPNKYFFQLCFQGFQVPPNR